MLDRSFDILILSNGPGELTTWVRPVVKQLRQQLGDDRSHTRISIILSPCPNATGKEAAIALSYPEVDRVQSAEYFWSFLLWGKTAQNWDWRDRGVVLFLGGDQFFTVVIGKRLGYRTIVYAEWEARWYRWIDRFGVMKPEISDRTPKKYSHKLTVVGDLMTEVDQRLATDLADELPIPSNQSAPPTNPSSITSVTKSAANPNIELIGLLPGSKPAKLSQGVPLGLAIAERIHAARPQTHFIIFVAPTLNIQTLANFANAAKNPVLKMVDGTTAELVMPYTKDLFKTPFPYLRTPSGLEISLCTRSPAYDLLSQCRLCLTTVGANTAELGALAVPAIVLLPTNQLDAMRSWDGLPGLLAKLPGVGSSFAKLINFLVLRQGKLFAWPNIWANKMIIPELVGLLQPDEVAKFALDYLEHPEKLEEMRDRLRHVRGQPGAAQKLAQLVKEELLQL